MSATATEIWLPTCLDGQGLCAAANAVSGTRDDHGRAQLCETFKRPRSIADSKPAGRFVAKDSRHCSNLRLFIEDPVAVSPLPELSSRLAQAHSGGDGTRIIYKTKTGWIRAGSTVRQSTARAA